MSAIKPNLKYPGMVQPMRGQNGDPQSGKWLEHIQCMTAQSLIVARDLQNIPSLSVNQD